MTQEASSDHPDLERPKTVENQASKLQYRTNLFAQELGYPHILLAHLTPRSQLWFAKYGWRFG